ncbi:MAG: DUF2784 domain-containing protein [Cyclobacteriaceae bacterium]
MLQFLDYFLTYFHTALILFVLSGWIFPQTRRSHALLLILILIAWFGIGVYKGVLGYCPLTDWHWDIKRERGERGMSSSFVEYMVEKISGINFSRKLVDGFTLGGLIMACIMAVVMSFKSRKTKA